MPARTGSSKMRLARRQPNGSGPNKLKNSTDTRTKVSKNEARSHKTICGLFDRLAWISCGYGVRPSHTILLSLAIILLFTGIFWAGDALPPDGGNGRQDKKGVSLNDAFYISSMQFLGKTPQNFSIIEGYEFMTVIETLLGWLLMALFLVTLSRVMMR